MEAFLAGFAGFSFGFGVSAVFYARVVVRKLAQLVDATVDAAAALKEFQETGTQRVEEQNMTQVVKRLDRLEETGIIRKEDEGNALD
jgi:hypothetical protein